MAIQHVLVKAHFGSETHLFWRLFTEEQLPELDRDDSYIGPSLDRRVREVFGLEEWGSITFSIIKQNLKETVFKEKIVEIDFSDILVPERDEGLAADTS